MTHCARRYFVVAIYDSHADAEAGVKALREGGVEMNLLSIVGKDSRTEMHALGFYTSGDRLKFWGGRGSFWAALWGTLCGGAFFFIPAIGPLVVMGPLVGWIFGALESPSAESAASVLALAFTSIGIPEESVTKYDDEVKAGKLLVLAGGSAATIEHVHAVLGPTGASHLAAHVA